jgi:hypothetical protein
MRDSIGYIKVRKFILESVNLKPVTIRINKLQWISNRLHLSPLGELCRFRLEMSRVLKLGNWIGGRSTTPLTIHKYLENVNPFTQEVLNMVPLSSETDVNAAVQCAKETFPIWSEITKQKRAEYLFNIANEIENNFEVPETFLLFSAPHLSHLLPHWKEFALAESLDTGKPLNLSRNLDIARSIDNFRFFAKTLLELPSVSYKQVTRETKHPFPP